MSATSSQENAISPVEESSQRHKFKPAESETILDMDTQKPVTQTLKKPKETPNPQVQPIQLRPEKLQQHANRRVLTGIGPTVNHQESSDYRAPLYRTPATLKLPEQHFRHLPPRQQGRKLITGGFIPPGLGPEGPFKIDPKKMTRDRFEAPRVSDKKMCGFIHAEMSVQKLKRLSTSGLMLMSVPKGHGLPSARQILQVVAGQKSKVDKEAFKSFMRNMKKNYEAEQQRQRMPEKENIPEDLPAQLAPIIVTGNGQSTVTLQPTEVKENPDELSMDPLE
ncbi:Oidioi.mRNA.OKI2018_I69.chr2.g7326.t1.cds [Oikopleura dioica]|uniref:Oidioi.mRNA.OKI2018_I69.chr2.g7326.t1.cds n=1 Tax=Oikopleura dioica TaxID=34765 RepID=A0ABN7T5U2_OIKDI|nr:Oidioi.mRNA.OKI2018_I69.chr2.g7326.t1.cds [Oikopleura dioica]